MAVELKIPRTAVLSSVWKTNLGIKGKERTDQKKDAQRFVKETYGVKATQDECDAICIGTYIVNNNIKIEEDHDWSDWVKALLFFCNYNEGKTKGGQLSLWDFIVKYWVEFAFGLMVAGGGYFVKRYFMLEKLNRQKEQDDFYNKIKGEIDKGYGQSQKDDETLQSEINDITGVLKGLRRGLLSV